MARTLGGAGGEMNESARIVFETISAHWAARSTDIARVAATGYSFEEWLNWEAFLACKSAGLDVKARPCYSTFGAEGCKDLADLLVLGQGASVVVEVGVVHDGIEGKAKWRAKLDGDGQKLLRIAPPTSIPLHLVVLASAKARIIDNPKGEFWLKPPPCWNTPPDLQSVTALLPQGEMLVQAWSKRANG